MTAVITSCRVPRLVKLAPGPKANVTWMCPARAVWRSKCPISNENPRLGMSRTRRSQRVSSASCPPSTRRPRLFYRGNDVYDPSNVGFVSSVPALGQRMFFTYDTAVPGNANVGHEGTAYGTELPREDKDALVEYLKTF